MSIALYTALLVTPACLEGIDLDKPTPDQVLALQGDDDALTTLCTPEVFPGLEQTTIDENVAACKGDAAYLRGLLRTWSNIIRDEDDVLDTEGLSKLMRARVASTIIFQMGPSLHWDPSKKVSNISFFNVAAPRPVAQPKSRKTIEPLQAALEYTFGSQLVTDIARHLRSFLSAPPAEFDGRKVEGEIPTELADLAAAGSDIDLVKAVALRKGGNFMVATMVQAPAQPMPHRLGKGKDAKDLGSFVPASRVLHTDSEGKVRNSGFPLALGWRFDAFRYPSEDEVKAKAQELGLLPTTTSAATPATPVQTEVVGGAPLPDAE